MSELRDQLIRIHRRNYRRNLAQLRESLAHAPAITRYEKEYAKYVGNFEEVSTKEDLYGQILASRFVYHGDYHTLKHSQRAILRILRDLAPQRQIILCLEMFQAEYQGALDKYLGKKWSEKKFLRESHYAETWPFPWENFKPLLDFCLEKKIRVVAMNTQPREKKNRLEERDRASARILIKESLRNPRALMYVVDGDFHVSPNHLPARVEELALQLEIDARRTIIYQNVEALYWRLCRLGREEAGVLKISPDSFCLMNTMPAYKIQSYLNWLDYAGETWIPGSPEWEDDSAPRGAQSLWEMVEALAKLLSLSFPREARNRLEIYYGGQLDLLDTLWGIPALKKWMPAVRAKVKAEEGFLLSYPQGDTYAYIIYLPHSGINMAAEEAAHFLNAILREGSGEPSRPMDRFYHRVLTECVGFFGSKLINEKRKVHSQASLRKFLRRHRGQRPSPRIVRLLGTAAFLVDHITYQRNHRRHEGYLKRYATRFKGPLWVAYSTQLGYYLGNRLYSSVKSGKFPLGEIRSLFSAPLNSPGEALDTYLRFIRETAPGP